jgi:tetratricopeptide (TPR) repeat protein
MIYKMRLQNKRRPALELRRRFDAYQALASLLTLSLFFSLAPAVFSRRAFGGSFGLFQQSPQQSRDKASGGGDEKDVRALEAGKPIKGELAGGRQHAYRISLGAGQFLKVVVEQQGIDVVAQVSGPDGKQILEFDSESRSKGQEEVSLVAESAGAFQLIVRPKQNGAPAGSYEIRIEELRVATDTDRALHDASKQFEEALKLQRAGKYDEARSLLERALEIRERLLGTEHRDVAACIDILAGVYANRGEYVKAEPLYLRALAICEKALGKDHPDTATVTSNLGKLYHYQGKYGEAEPLYKRSLDIREKALGKDHLDTAEGLNTLAVLYSMQGKYVEAEPLHQRALDIREKALGKDHPDTAQSLNNLALVYDYQGKYEEAEPLYKRSLDIREKALGKDHPSTAISLNNLATLYTLQEKFKEAEPLYKRSLEIREKALGKDHPSTATGISNLARIYDYQGKYEEAEPLYKRALDIFEKALGKDNPDTANSINNLGTLYRRQGKYEESELLYKRALEFCEKSLGNDHTGTIIALNSLSALYMAKGDLVQAVKFQSRANAGSERNLARNLVIGSERQKLAYLAVLSKQTDRTISLHLHSAPDDPAAGALAATLVLQRKGRALDATSQNLNSLRSRFNAEDQALLDRLTETRSQIAGLVLSGPQRMTFEQHRDRIKALEDQADKDEADISRRSDEFRAQFLPVTLEAVRAAIPPDSALIEFASYHPYNAKATNVYEDHGQPCYVAYVLRREGEIEWKELGDAKSIDAAI